jgi:hypothetical protein
MDQQFCLQLLPGMPQLLQTHRLVGQQQDNLCGPYWTAMLLNTFDQVKTTPETVALLAGSILPIGNPNDWVPPGATSRQDYHLSPPETDCIEDSGTSSSGLIHAIAKASEGRFGLISLQTDGTATAIETLLQLCLAHPEWQAMPICNIATGYLWGSRLSFVDAIAYLSGTDIAPPAADWQVGHFFLLAGMVAGPQRRLILVQDTYPILGWDGYHLQSSQAIATAIERPDQATRGGVLLFVSSQVRTAVEQAVTQHGFKIAAWDNGTPWTSP